MIIVFDLKWNFCVVLYFYFLFIWLFMIDFNFVNKGICKEICCFVFFRGFFLFVCDFYE